MDEFWPIVKDDNVLFTDDTSPEISNYIYESSSRPPSQFSSGDYYLLENDDGYASNYVYESSSSTSPPSHFSNNGSYVCLDNEDEFVMLPQDYTNQNAECGTQFIQDTESDLMPPIPPARSRSKMHDLALKRCLITAGNIRTNNGMLVLSAEEKRTLVQEGYEVPTTLPLSREQEEALKIVRRKIKNKLSAQESRRKRKQYVDSLEKKVHAYYSEVMSLRNRLKQAEAQNREINSQLKRYQAAVDIKDGLL